VDAQFELCALRDSDAAAHLRYVAEVRSLTRRGAVMPSSAHLALGALVLIRGLLMRYLPHLTALPTAWLVMLLALRPVSMSLEPGSLLGGVHQKFWDRAAPPLLATACALVAVAIGADALISAVAGALCVSAWRAGLAAIATSTAALGVFSDALAMSGAPPGTALIALGTGLTLLGMARLRMRRSLA
jgi:hypothetical protein